MHCSPSGKARDALHLHTVPFVAFQTWLRQTGVVQDALIVQLISSRMDGKVCLDTDNFVE